MVVDCALYVAGRRVRTLGLDELGDVPTNEGEFLWVSLHEPDAATLGIVQRRFALHELAVEDAMRAHQRPKLEEYDAGAFLVMRTARWDAAQASIDLGEVHAFFGARYIVVVRHGETPALEELRDRCEAVQRLLAKGPAYVLYALMDVVVDRYFPLADDLEDEVEALEDRLFSDELDRDLSKRIYELKAQLNLFKRAAGPLLEVLNHLTRLDVAIVREEERLYFRDVYDHVIRVNETIDGLRELLTGALEANLALVSVRQNDTMRKLAAWAAILALPTLAAGVYGMNFHWIPFLDASRGFHGFAAVMAGACGFLFWRFRRIGWL